MKTSFAAALLAAPMLGASLLGAPAFAQAPPATLVPAPAPSATAPVVPPGAVPTPLIRADTLFVQAQLEGNTAEIQAAHLALQHSQDQSVRNFAEKMITDHSYAESLLMPIAERHHIQTPPLTPQHDLMLTRLAALNGPAFDRAYVDGMVRSHETIIKELNAQLIHGESQQINAWVQNTRPIVLQHIEIAQKLQASLQRPS